MCFYGQPDRKKMNAQLIVFDCKQMTVEDNHVPVNTVVNI